MRADPTHLRLASGREEASQELHDTHPMPWTAGGELRKLEKGQFWNIFTDTPEDDKDTWKNTPRDRQTDSVETQSTETAASKETTSHKNKVRQLPKQQQHVCKFTHGELTRNRTGLELRRHSFGNPV